MPYQHRLIVATVLLFTWVLTVSAALFYFGNQHYGQFDQDNTWHFNTPVDFSISVLAIAPTSGMQVVHIKQNNCRCNSRAAQHVAKFTDEYQLSEAVQFQRQPTEVSAAGLRIPAAPAVLIFDNGQLIYAGPYATGPLCSLTDSLIAPILRDEVQLPGVWFNGEAKACRCISEPI